MQFYFLTSLFVIELMMLISQTIIALKLLLNHFSSPLPLQENKLERLSLTFFQASLASKFKKCFK